MRLTWENAYQNTSKIPFGIGSKIVCGECRKVTQTKGTTERQLIGNCYQMIVECQECNNYFVDSWKQ